MRINEVVFYDGTVEWDTSKPDGTPRRPLHLARIHALGWRHSISFREGITRTYEWFKEHYKVDAKL